MADDHTISLTLARTVIGACVGGLLSSKLPGPEFNHSLLKYLSTITGGLAAAAATSSTNKFEDIFMRGTIVAVGIPSIVGGWIMCTCNDNPGTYDDLTCATMWRFCVYGWMFGMMAAFLASTLMIALTSPPRQRNEEAPPPQQLLPVPQRP